MHTEGRDSPLASLRSLIAQICVALSLSPKKYLKSHDLKEIKENVFPQLLRDPKGYTKLQELGGERLIIVIDALDEGITGEEFSIASCIPLYSVEKSLSCVSNASAISCRI